MGSSVAQRWSLLRGAAVLVLAELAMLNGGIDAHERACVASGGASCSWMISGLEVFTQDSNDGFIMTVRFNVASRSGAASPDIDAVVVANGILLGSRSGRGSHEVPPPEVSNSVGEPSGRTRTSRALCRKDSPLK